MDEKIYSERQYLEGLLELSEELEVSQLNIARAYAKKKDVLDEFDNICAQAPRGPHDFGELMERAVQHHSEENRNGKAIDDLVTMVGERNEESLALIEQSILEHVTKPSKFHILYETGKRFLFDGVDIAKGIAINVAKFPYYAVLGALPAKYQKKIADEKGHDQFKYIAVNGFVSIAVTSSAMYYLACEFEFGGAETVSVLILMGAVDTLVLMIRCVSADSGHFSGHPLLTLPYYSLRIAGEMGKAITSYVSDMYQAAEKDLTVKSLPAPKVRVEVPKEAENMYVDTHSADRKKGNLAQV